jgi:type I restriction enzyme S subunit
MPTNVSIGELFSIEKGLLQSTKCTPGEYDFITASSKWKTHNEFDHEGEYLIFAAAASGSLGRTHYVKGKFISSDLCYILEPKNPEKYPINMHFYHFVFNSLRSALVANTKSGTSKEAINQKNFKKYKLPYFDIEQQDFWIDKLKNTLDIKNHFSDEAANQQDLLKKLRQQILQDAIEGKLTKDWREQNPDVEPASELLKRIEAEKQQLIKDKKIKKQKPLPAITDDEKPFELPDGWEWCRLDYICTKITDGFHNTPPKVSSGYPYIAATHVKSNNIDWDGCHYVSEEFHRELYSKTYPKKGEVLIVNIGAGSGTPAIIDVDFEFSFKNTAILKFNQKKIVNKYIFNYFLLQRDVIYKELTKGGLQPFLSLKILRSINIPLPSVHEQKEIVKKVENLFTICDQLEEQITSSQTNADQLMQSVLKEAFSQDEKVA